MHMDARKAKIGRTHVNKQAHWMERKKKKDRIRNENLKTELSCMLAGHVFFGGPQNKTGSIG